MLFMGSTHFPDENEYDSYLSKHGGSSNAYTETEHTCYHFEVKREFLKGALRRFSLFFISPLVKSEAMERERLADTYQHDNLVTEFNQVLQSDPALSSKFFLRQTWSDGTDETTDYLLKHKPFWSAYSPNLTKDKKKKREIKKKGDLYRTYGTRVIPIFVLSLSDVDEHLMMEDESLVWTSNEVIIVLQRQNEKNPLSE